MKACIRPGRAFWKSLRCPRTWVSSRVVLARVGVLALRRARAAHELGSRPRTTREEHDRRHEDGRQSCDAYEPVRRRISAVRAGTT